MRIISRYVLREHVGPLTFSLSALTSLLLLDYVARSLGDLVGKGLPWQAIVSFFVLSVPFTVALTLPMAVLVSTLYAFGRLAAENEITGFEASGVAMSALLGPVLRAAAVLAALMVGFNDQVLPAANHELSALLQDVLRAKPTFALREQVINPVTPSFLLRAARVDRARGTMRDVTIYDMTAGRTQTIRADSGAVAFATNRKDLQLSLYHGSIEQLEQGKPESLRRVYYRTDVVLVKDVASGEFTRDTTGEGTAFRGGRDMSVCELSDAYLRARREYLLADLELRQAIADSAHRPRPTAAPTRRVFLGVGRLYCRVISAIPPRAASAAEVRPHGQLPPTPPVAQPSPPPAAPGLAADTSAAAVPVAFARTRLGDARMAMNTYLVEVHKKFALAAACLVFALIGAPLALRFPRGGVGMVLGVSLPVFAVYHALLVAGQELGARGMVSPWLSMWGANLLFTAVGLPLALRMGRERGSARGGGAEWVARLGYRVRAARRGAGAERGGAGGGGAAA